MANIGRYTILRKLATGGMAEVYLAKVAGPGGFEKRVVLKKILPQLADNEDYVKMFLSEARLAAQLDHPNIVHVFDFGESEGTYFLAMEYVDGANLRQVLRWAIRNHHPMHPTVVARIISLACEGLAYAHEFTPADSSTVTRLVHRDVSPENIMLSRVGAVKLLDFGVAKVSSEDHRSKAGSLKGKVAYMPPEQVKGEAIDHRTDIYALGVVLYQTLSGRRPYGQATDVALINAILNQEPTPLLKHRLDLPDNLLDIVSKAMMKDPAARFQNCIEMHDALEAYIAHEGLPVGASQIAALVAAYAEANPDASTGRASLASQPNSGNLSLAGADPTDGGSRSPTDRSAGRGTPTAERGTPSRGAPLLERTTPAPQRTPSPTLPPEPPTLPSGLRGVQAKTQPHAQVPVAIPIAQGTLAEERVEPARAAPPPAPASLEPAHAQGAVHPRAWRPAPVGSEPVRKALRDALRSDQSTYLARKLPAVISRLVDVSRSVPHPLAEAMAGLIASALLADDHTTVSRLLDRAEAKPGKDRRFAHLVTEQLQHPLLLAWLVERLRSGLPTDASGLRGWLGRLGPSAGPLLLEALEASDPGPAQDFFAEALANTAASDPSLLCGRLEAGPPLRNVAALCFALERSQVAERSRVFQGLIGKRDVALQCEVLAGRARGRGTDALVLLEGGAGDKAEEVRKRAIELIGQLGGAKGFALLEKMLADPGFENRTAAEKSRIWAASLDCAPEAASARITAVLMTKPSLLNKKKVNEVKLAVIDGLSRARTEAARAVLESVAADRSQGEEVLAAAKAALAGTRVSSKEHVAHEARPVGERRAHVLARVVLDFALLARASTTVDAHTGHLDSALEQFREGLRAVLAQDGRFHFEAGPVPTVNGVPVSFGAQQQPIAAAVTQIFEARRFHSLLVEAMVPLAEFRALLLRAFDPDGRQERTPHLKAMGSDRNPLAAVSEPALPPDTSARAKELFGAMVRWLHAQRDTLRRGGSITLAGAETIADELARLSATGATHFMGAGRWSPSDTGTLVHSANTAVMAMAFAHDLGLPRTALREVGTTALMLGLAEAVGPADKRPAPGQPTHDEERLYAAGLLLTLAPHRLGAGSAVAAIEAGLPASTSGRGPGLLASILALCKAFDALTAGGDLTTAAALEQINGPLRERFSADLLGLFAQWAFAQPPPQRG